MPVAPPSVRVLPHLGIPGEVFSRIRGKSGAFLLESTAKGELGRWSFLGCAPAATLEATESEARLTSGSTVLETWSDPFSALDELTSRYRPEGRPDGLSPPFRAGFVGYLGYDLARLIERVPTSATDDLRLPLMRLSLVDQIFSYDNRTGTWFETNTHLEDFDLAQRQAAWARTRGALRQGPGVLPSFSAGRALSRTGDEMYLQSVRRVLDLIAAGDVFQVNLSHRLEAPFAGDAFAYYLRLAELSPAPFAAYLAWPDLALAGCSPERFLRCSGGRVETRPIKGTSPRSEDPLNDAARRDSLGKSAKDRAETTSVGSQGTERCRSMNSSGSNPMAPSGRWSP
jgi:para-aminobenzoate synthetase component 1